MTRLILDASMALAWIFERQNKEEAARAEKVLTMIVDIETIVPTLWHIELINALLIGERRKVVTKAQIIDYLNRLEKLPILTDENALANRREVVTDLAREHALTAYDAIYLDLALRSNALLATFDTKLAKAMHKAGGSLI